MKNTINYYYNLFPQKIFQNKNEYYFFINDIRYSFIKYNEDIEKINEIYNMHLDILKNNIYVHSIILNKDSKPLTIVNNTYYILLQTMYYGNKINLDTILPFTKAVSKKKHPNWEILWAEKNDYLEYLMKECGVKYQILKDSFAYFIGLAETAISILNITEKEEINYVYSHKRIDKTQTTFDLYNPLNITVDLKTRDAAEYFKQSFFKGENIEDEITKYLTNSNLTKYEYISFLSRLLYPTYYFDLFEQLINEKHVEKQIEMQIKKIDKYELLLKKIYNYYKSFINIYQIEWLEY